MTKPRKRLNMTVVKTSVDTYEAENQTEYDVLAARAQALDPAIHSYQLLPATKAVKVTTTSTMQV